MDGGIKIITDRDGYPIRLYKLVEVAKFRSIAHAAKHIGASLEAVRQAVNKGGSCYGYQFRYADMPVECQPLKTPKRHRVPVVWEGKLYPSILAAAGGKRNKALYMRISRIARRVMQEGRDEA